MTPAFIQIVTGAWNSGKGLNHTLYGLTADGKVYRYEMYEGWREVIKRTKSEKATFSNEPPEANW